MRSRVWLLAALCALALGTPCLVQGQGIQLPELTPDQRWARLEFHWASWAAVATAYAEEQGHSVDEFGRWIGKQFAPGWGERGSGTPAGLVRGWYRNAAAWRDLEFEILEATDNMVKARSSRPWVQGFGTEGVFGLTEAEVDRLVWLVYDEIATHLGLAYEQQLDGEDLVITVRRR